MEEEAMKVGLIKGRHSLPVNEYIFNEEINFPLDFQKLDEIATGFIEENKRNKDLVVYVTGLTACTASVIKACACNGVALTLMHFDPTTQTYNPQIIF
jgi:hypothetical protein